MTIGEKGVPPAGLKEVRDFFDTHRQILAIELYIVDVNGVARGKWVPRSDLEKLLGGGVRLARSAYALDIWGDEAEASGLIWETGDADGACHPVADSLCVVPWLERPTAQFLASMYDDDGRPFYADPRHVLGAVLDRFHALDLWPVVAFEPEFYLVDGSDLGHPRPASSRRAPNCPSDTQVYGIDEIHHFVDLLGDMTDACAVQGIPATTVVSEHAPGQFEINLQHDADALRAADHAFGLKRTVKGVARKHGLAATFMAKPFAELAGNGCHLHFSLLDGNGRNIFDDDTDQGSRALKWAIAGLAESMADFHAVFAPNANSYRRLRKGSYAPLAPSWGYENRTTALRIPLGPGQARRIEHRVSGADSNPYLALAAILAGAHHGLIKQLESEPPTTGNAYQQHPPSLPTTWEQALQRFDEAEIVREYFGAPFQTLYSACKWQEWDRFARHVGELEHHAYLTTV